METPQLPSSDHDLLVTLVANMQAMREDFRLFSTNFSTQLSDHEARLRVAEQTTNELLGSRNALRWMVSIAAAIGGLAGPLVAYIIGSRR